MGLCQKNTPRETECKFGLSILAARATKEIIAGSRLSISTGSRCSKVDSSSWEDSLSELLQLCGCLGIQKCHNMKYFPMNWLFINLVSSQHSSRAGFLSLGALDILGWIILCCGVCPVHCKMFSSIPGLDPPEASSRPSPPPQVVTTRSVSRHWQMSHGGGQDCPRLRTTAL